MGYLPEAEKKFSDFGKVDRTVVVYGILHLHSVTCLQNDL